MNKPALYNISNNIQRNISLSNFKKYVNKMKWNKTGDTVIDVGCGDGSFTIQVKNLTSNKYSKFVACDRNDDMIHFAKMHYADKDVTFTVMDITGKVPEDMDGAFNHVFSFFVLHWVKDQEKAFKNIYKLMANDGDCFMTFVGSSATYSIYAVLANHPKWKSWLKRIDELFKGPYHGIKNPEKKVTEIMTKCGFKNIDVKCEDHVNVYDSMKALRDFVHALEPFKMPNEVFDEFIQDYITVGQELGVLHIENQDTLKGSYVTQESTIIIYANK